MITLATLAIFFAFALRGYTPTRPPGASATPRATPRFLLEVEAPGQKVRIGNRGELPGGGALTQSQWVDLREAVGRLRADQDGQGAWKLRFYDAEGAHELSFDPQKGAREQREIVQHLKLLGLLK